MKKTINIFGSTGIIGSKTLKIINEYFPNIKINLLTANHNYKKLSKQIYYYNLNIHNICSCSLVWYDFIFIVFFLFLTFN